MTITNEQFAEIRKSTIPLTQALCFILGWQGGTVHQVAQELQVSTSDILEADDLQAGDLCRKAQQVKGRRGVDKGLQLLHKHLGVCIGALKADYHGHDTPPWLERAEGVHKIMGEIVEDHG